MMVRDFFIQLVRLWLWLIGVILIALALGGCASRLGPYAAVADQERKDLTDLVKMVHDAKAATTIDLLGNIRTRVYLEMSPDEQAAVACLVVGDCSGQRKDEIVSILDAVGRMKR